ncbi:MAG: hypothetical protein NC908_03180, partial [Candidatus Omnitrophica bacterium]|nr:hypothetical protein [Candidatus Omnitrophota bacterium]
SEARSGIVYIEGMEGAVHFDTNLEEVGVDPANPQNIIVVNRIGQIQYCNVRIPGTDNVVRMERKIPLGVIARSVPAADLAAVREGRATEEQRKSVLLGLSRDDAGRRRNFGEIIGHGGVIRTAAGNLTVEIRGEPNDSRPPVCIVRRATTGQIHDGFDTGEVQAIEKRINQPQESAGVIAANDDAVRQVEQRCRRLQDIISQHMAELQEVLSPDEIARVQATVAAPRRSFNWFNAIVEGRRRYFLGSQRALAVNLIRFLLDRERQTGQRDLLTEYILHEALERTNLSHREIIILTTRILHPELTGLIAEMEEHLEDDQSGIRGRTPLGRCLREFIDDKVALARGREIVANLKRTPGATAIKIARNSTMVFLWNPSLTPTGGVEGERAGKFVILTSVEQATEIARGLIPHVATGEIPSVKFAYDPEAYGFSDTALLVYCTEENPAVRTMLEREIGCKVEGWKPNSESTMEGDVRRELSRLSYVEISKEEAARLETEYPIERLRELISARRYLPPSLRNDYQVELILDLLDTARIQRLEPFRRRLALYHLRLYPDVGIRIRYLIDREIHRQAGSRTQEVQEQLRAQRFAHDVLRELSVGETANFMAAASSFRINRIIQDTKKTSLVIGIPKENATPQILGAIQQRLISLGRTDCLVIPVDREDMQEKLNKLGVPFGVILDIDNMENIEKILEPFMTELDLQGLFKDYPLLYKVSTTKLDLDRATLIKIMRDRRLLPSIISLDLEYILSNGTSPSSQKCPTRKRPTQSNASRTLSNLVIDREKSVKVRRPKKSLQPTYYY